MKERGRERERERGCERKSKSKREREVGARGTVGVDLLMPALEFLAVPKQKWTGMMDATIIPAVRASAQELACMNRIRVSAPSQSFDTHSLRQASLSRATKQLMPTPRFP